MSIWTLFDGAAGITLGCILPAIGYLVIRGIRASVRFAVATWREITPEQDEYGRPLERISERIMS